MSVIVTYFFALAMMFCVGLLIIGVITSNRDLAIAASVGAMFNFLGWLLVRSNRK